MRAMILHEFGEPDVLKLEEIDKPAPAEHELLVEVHAAGLNPVDYKIRSGGFRAAVSPPLVPGYDVSGVVAEVGSAVSGFKVGDAVFAFNSLFANGSHAEYVRVDARAAARKPHAVDHVTAAALPVAVLTAWEAVHDRCRLHTSETILIHAGAGGVGHLAIQLAKLHGSRVITTAGRDESIALCKQLGADVVINYREEDVAERVEKETDGRGCEVVCDFVGGEVFNTSIACLAPDGRLATIVGVPENAPMRDLFVKNGTLHTVFIAVPYAYGIRTDAHSKILQTVAELLEADKLKVHVSKTWPLDELPEAHRAQETGHVTGKQVIVMKSNEPRP